MKVKRQYVNPSINSGISTNEWRNGAFILQRITLIESYSLYEEFNELYINDFQSGPHELPHWMIMT